MKTRPVLTHVVRQLQSQHVVCHLINWHTTLARPSSCNWTVFLVLASCVTQTRSCTSYWFPAELTGTPAVHLTRILGFRFWSWPAFDHPAKLAGYESFLLRIVQIRSEGCRSKAAGQWVERQPSCSSEVKNKWRYTSAPPICLHGVVRHNLTLRYVRS